MADDLATPMNADENPYASPAGHDAAPSVAQRAFLSRARIPLGVICTLIMVLLVVMALGLAAESVRLEGSSWQLAVPCVLFAEAVAFGLLAIGLFARQSRTVLIGLGLFCVPICVAIVAVVVVIIFA
jgi:hypothetical protein